MSIIKLLSISLLLVATIFGFVVKVTASGCCRCHNISNPYPMRDAISPNLFTIRFETNVVFNGKRAEPFIMNVTRALAPLGADRLYSLVKDNYFTNATFFRLVPNFVLQFGIAGQRLCVLLHIMYFYINCF